MFDNNELIPANDFRSLVKYDVTPEQIEAKKAAANGNGKTSSLPGTESAADTSAIAK